MSGDQPTELICGRESRPRVLIVEPNRKYLGVVARRLHAHGYRTITAADGASALAEVHRSAPDLVLTAARLPGTSGIELLRMIRSEPAGRHMPVLLVVGRSDPAAAIGAFEAGADSVIRKPCHFEVLAACVARHLERARAVQQLLHDNAALDARVVSRAIEVGEIRARCEAAEAEGQRLRLLLGRAA